MDLVVGKRYILSEKINIDNVGGGFHLYAKELQINSHILIDKKELTYSNLDYLLTFKKEFSEEFTYPAPLYISTLYIYSNLKNKGFILDKQEAAKTIQKLVKEKQVKRKTIENLYAPGGHGYNATLKHWQRSLENQEIC